MTRELSYVMPVRWHDDAGLDELTAYLRGLAREMAEVIVVDRSPEPLFAAHARAWEGLVTHLPIDPDVAFVMQKVDGVETGMRRVSHEKVVLADDDVRYGPAELDAMAAALDDADLVRPHNFFAPLVWHARWDTGRTLLNRALGGDFPGTLGLRASIYRAMGGYDGDVLFENLELMRTVAAAGGRVRTRLDLLVARRPPSTRHFLSQRVRQAYDDFALPLRMAAFLAVGPAVAALIALRRPAGVAALAAGCVVLAESGRRRGGGARVYPLTGSLLAPAWALERGITMWLAVGRRVLSGGVPYGDRIIRRSATPVRTLRRRLAQRPPAPAPRPRSAR